jgi:hypothetical protein
MQELSHTDRETPQYWPKRMPYRIPPDYFVRQRKAILKLLRHEWTGNPPEKAIAEIDRLSPLLSNLKRKGVRGRWDQSLPVQDASPAEHTEATEIKIEKTPVKKMHKSWIWAAAALTGLLLMGRFITEQRDLDIINVKDGISYNMMKDSIGISDEEIRSYLSETAEFPIEKGQNPTRTTVQEAFLANADLLAAPEVFSNYMDAIPVHELEAYMNDIPSLNN